MESKIEDRRAMELLKLDVDNAISDIERRCKCIDEFCKKINCNPLEEVPLMRPSFTSLSRYKSIDRNRLINVFNECYGKEGCTMLLHVYSYLDYYYEAVSTLYNDLDKENKDELEEYKNEVTKSFQIIRKKAMTEKYRYDMVLVELIRTFIKSSTEILTDGVPNLIKLNEIINDSQYKELYSGVLEFEYSSLKELMDAIIAKNKIRSKAMMNAAETFRSDKCLGELKRVSNIFETTLNKHTEECILKDFEGKI